MGQGGYIAIVNTTKYDFESTKTDSKSMNKWKFPDTIKAGTSERIYVEWEEGVFHDKKKDEGNQTYTLKGVGWTFKVKARAKNGFKLSVVLEDFATQGVAKGTEIDLGWEHDGTVTFILSGDKDNFTSTMLSGAWMHNNLASLGNRALIDLCIPGSHDAGMSEFNAHTAGAFNCNTVTQTKNMLKQLEKGARYFDIRPVISAGKFYTGHYGEVGPSGQGANGQSIKDIINEVNNYTSTYKELVILHLSHDLNTDVGNFSYRPFTQKEWDKLFAQLEGLNHLYINNNKYVKLADLDLNSYIGNGPAVIVLVKPEADDISLGNYSGKGFFPNASFKIYNKYSETNDVGKMADDQLAKMEKKKGGDTPSYFLLSWTLTQSDTQAVTCITPGVKSILDLAKIANQKLYYKLIPKVTKTCFPNILYIDRVSGKNIAAGAMAINSVITS